MMKKGIYLYSQMNAVGNCDEVITTQALGAEQIATIAAVWSGIAID